jgi:hypothetical protein
MCVRYLLHYSARLASRLGKKDEKELALLNSLEDCRPCVGPRDGGDVELPRSTSGFSEIFCRRSASTRSAAQKLMNAFVVSMNARADYQRSVTNLTSLNEKPVGSLSSTVGRIGTDLTSNRVSRASEKPFTQFVQVPTLFLSNVTASE